MSGVVVVGSGEAAAAVAERLARRGVEVRRVDEAALEVWAVSVTDPLVVHCAVAGNPTDEVTGKAVVLASEPVSVALAGIPAWSAPPSQLARAIGCGADWDESATGWVVRRRADLSTAVPGVYVVGAAAGAFEPETIRAEAAVVADAVSVALGATPSLRGPWRRWWAGRLLQRERRARLTVQPSLLAEWAALAPGTVICPCEGLTLADVAGVLEDRPEATTLRDLKLLSRFGMGACQGRRCGPAVVRWAAASGRVDLIPDGLRPRIPVVPLTLSPDVADTGPLPTGPADRVRPDRSDS